MPLPKNATARKVVPIASGFIDYFPDAIAAVAHLSWVGNEQHNPGSPLHWDRSKSGDESDALMRHFLERGTTDEDGVRHSAKVAWRALAMLQKEIEADTEVERVPGYDVRESILTEGERATLQMFDREVLKQYEQRAALNKIKAGIQQPVKFRVDLDTYYPYGADSVDEIEEWQRNKADAEAYLRRLNEGWAGPCKVD